MRSRLYIVLIGVWVMLFQACSNDALEKPEASDTELATVNIRVSTRANNGTDSNMDANEGIKALRVIVLDEDWKILDNWYQEGLGGTEGKTEEKNITLQLPRTKVRFLAIANEKSMGRSFDTASLMEDNFLSYLTNGLKEIFNRAWDDATPAFPKTAVEIAQYGLPMTGVKGCHDIFSGEGEGTSDGEHHDYNCTLYQDEENPFDLSGVTSINIEIPLVRCVSKLVVNVQNVMNEDLEISSVNFGRFYVNKVYYYAHQPLHLPYETVRNSHAFPFPEDKAFVVKADGTEQILIAYFYPVALPNANNNYRYSISLKSNIAATSNYQVFLKKTDSSSGTTDIGRNKMVVINCTVNVNKLMINDLILIADPWDDATMDDIIFN